MSSPIIPPSVEEMIPNDPALLDEIIRQAEARLQAQLQSAIASDNRAMVLASFEGAATAALAVGVVHGDLTGLTMYSALGAGLPLFIGTTCAAWSARPVPFGFVGSNPSDWLDPIKESEPILRSRAYYATYLDEYLRLNARFMQENAGWTKVALLALVLAPLLAGFAAFISKVF